ncbi:endolytic transglycosylase MltG [Paenisporosarcina cavernae]|uniref:endolytic transglycosylase MltG n=1 Tax=Paenisporosarcina cavernae TaxID=2320858 RepID=UPI0013C4A3B3|nr:endolytic transglycosylase MltG [Paenisporosarcina cavernae]
MKEILQGVGIGLILSGSLFWFMQEEDISHSSNEITTTNKEKIAHLTKQLEERDAQLAEVQLDLLQAQQETTAEPSLSEGTKQEEVPEEDEKSNKVVLVVQPGMSSGEISAILEAEGIIQNKKDLDTYLADNNLSSRIQIGSYTLSKDMTLAEIAKVLTK